jgi:methylase of polypeptide subunit release factors
MQNRKYVRILDLGVGSGALLLATVKSLLHSESPPSCVRGCGIDISSHSLAIAKENLDRNSEILGISDSRDKIQIETMSILIEPPVQTQMKNHGSSVDIKFCEGDFTVPSVVQNTLISGQRYDLIMSNPPYLSERAVLGRITNEAPSTVRSCN